jgi:hypothetical protein
MDAYWLAIAQQTYERVFPQVSRFAPWSSLGPDTKRFWVTVVRSAQQVLPK